MQLLNEEAQVLNRDAEISALRLKLSENGLMLGSTEEEVQMGQTGTRTVRVAQEVMLSPWARAQPLDHIGAPATVSTKG